jgi:hypothetical protein
MRFLAVCMPHNMYCSGGTLVWLGAVMLLGLMSSKRDVGPSILLPV